MSFLFLFFNGILAQDYPSTETVYLFKGEKRYLQDNFIIYENTSLIHSLNPFILITNISTQFTYPVLAVFKDILILRKGDNEIRINYQTSQKYDDIEIYCQDLLFQKPLEFSLIIFICNDFNLNYQIYDYSSKQFPCNSTLNLTHTNLTYQWNQNYLLIVDNIGTENWKLAIFEITLKRLFQIKHLESTGIEKGPLLQVQLFQNIKLDLYLLFKEEVILFNNILSQYSDMVYMYQIKDKDCKYHRMNIQQKAFFIYNCANKYYTGLNKKYQINQETQIVSINSQLLLLNQNKLFFEDPLIPHIFIQSETIQFYDDYFVFVSDNRLYEYQVTQPSKYLYSNVNYSIQESFTGYSNNQERPMKIYYYCDIHSFIQTSFDTVLQMVGLKQVIDEDNFSTAIFFNQPGFQIRDISPIFFIQNHEYQCMNEEVDFVYLVKVWNKEYGKDNIFEENYIESTWFVQKNNTLMLISFNSHDIKQLILTNNFTVFYKEHICFIEDILIYRVDEWVYIIRYIYYYLSIEIQIIQYEKFNFIQNCRLMIKNNMSYYSSHQMIDIIQSLSNEIIPTFNIKQIKQIDQIEQILQFDVEQQPICIISIKKRLILIYIDRIENYLIINGVLFHSYTFSLRKFEEQNPHMKTLFFDQKLVFQIHEEKLAIKVENQDQKFIFVFNFNSGFLQCLEFMIQSEFQQFVLYQDFIAIQNNNKVKLYYFIIQPIQTYNLDFEGQLSKRINLQLNISSFWNNIIRHKEYQIQLLNNYQFIRKKQQDSNSIQLQQKITTLNINNYFYGSIYEVMIKENLQLNYPLQCQKIFRLNSEYQDIFYDKSILILKQNQIFILQQSMQQLRSNQLNINNELSKQFKLILRINNDRKCSQIFQFNDIIVSICKKDQLQIILMVFINFIYVDEIAINWMLNSKIKVEYFNNNFLLCSIHKLQITPNVYQDCQFIEFINNTKLILSQKTIYQQIQFQNHFVEYKQSSSNFEFILNNKTLSFNISTLFEKEFGSSIFYTPQIIQIYTNNENIYIVAKPRQYYLAIIKLQQDNLYILFYLQINSDVRTDFIIQLIENKYCIVLSEKNQEMILTYYLLDQQSSNYYFPKQVLNLNQTCSFKIFKQDNVENYFYCLGDYFKQDFYNSDIYKDTKNSKNLVHYHQLTIIKIQDIYQIIIPQYFKQDYFTLQVSNSQDTQEIIIQIERSYNYISSILLFLFILILVTHFCKQTHKPYIKFKQESQ